MSERKVAKEGWRNSTLEARPLPTFRQRQTSLRPFINPLKQNRISTKFRNGPEHMHCLFFLLFIIIYFLISCWFCSHEKGISDQRLREASFAVVPASSSQNGFEIQRTGSKPLDFEVVGISFLPRISGSEPPTYHPTLILRSWVLVLIRKFRESSDETKKMFGI